ncbi:Carbamoyl-phosphate synthase large chain [Raoultella terrigena]|uniref:Carbamoyl-phosphate synthase large chain n=1 Tax=Raoultella terrigena TaxID=577 RepID=A0A4U9DD44_RAOTE|nr:Carbamoyl-phosphate synthase large chain [Raoultella terrigena]
MAALWSTSSRQGVHSGDSACSLPAYTLSQDIQNVMREQVQKLAFELQVRGLMNVQFAVKNNEVYLIEVNPRAARTVPFVSQGHRRSAGESGGTRNGRPKRWLSRA